jgi:hypothetical protein
LQFEIELEYFLGINWPTVNVDCISTSEYIVNDNTRCVKFLLDATDSISFLYKNKSESETVLENNQIIRDQAVKIKRIWCEDIALDLTLLLPCIKFSPEYNTGFLNYCSDHNITPDPSPFPLELYHNGSWTFTFDKDFWAWYALLRSKEQLKYHTQDTIELYIGNNHTAHTELFEKLKSLLNNV